MKIFLCLLLVNGINFVFSFQSELSRDLNDIASAITNQDIFQIIDPDIFNPLSKNASNYARSIDFHNGLFLFTRHPAMTKIKQYLDSNQIDLIDIFLKAIQGMEEMRNSSEPIGRRKLKFQSLVQHTYSVKPNNIISLIIHKSATSPAFRILYNLLNILDFNKLYSDMIAVPKVNEIVVNLNKVGINTHELWKAFSYLFGWDKVTNIISFEEYEIEEDQPDENESPLFFILRQYLNLIPKEKFIILYNGLLTNPLFQDIAKFIYDKKYHTYLKQFEKNLFFAQFYDYLESRDVDYIKVVDLIRDRLGFTYIYNNMPSGKYEANSYSFSLFQCFELSKQILPINEIRKLTISLLDSSEEYREFSGIIINFVQNHNVDLYFENQLEIRSTAVQYGFGISKIFNFIFLLFGVEYEIPEKGKEFTNSLYEFIELIPKDSYIDLYHKYKNDFNIWKIVSYLKGPGFADFVEALFSTVELRMFSNYLIKEYLPFKVMLIDILDRLGIMQWWINYDFYCEQELICRGAINPNTDNMHNFVTDRMNLFPIKEILILFHSKLQTNPYFQNLYLEISNIDGANLFKKIIEHDVLRSFLVKFSKIGYNFRQVMLQFSQLFGWGNIFTVDLSLNQTIENFDNLIYRKELFKILNKYPDEVQQLKELFRNTAFINSFNILVNEPPIRNTINWMQNLNVPVINYINFYSGQDTPNSYNVKLNTSLKWKLFSADIVKFLNKNKLFDFSILQKYNSIEFNALLKKILAINSDITQVVHKHPEFHYVMDKLLSTGIDFDEIYKFIENVDLDAFDEH